MRFVSTSISVCILFLIAVGCSSKGGDDQTEASFESDKFQLAESSAETEVTTVDSIAGLWDYSEFSTSSDMFNLHESAEMANAESYLHIDSEENSWSHIYQFGNANCYIHQGPRPLEIRSTVDQFANTVETLFVVVPEIEGLTDPAIFKAARENNELVYRWEEISSLGTETYRLPLVNSISIVDLVSNKCVD